jgi:hypothetical protein
MLSNYNVRSSAAAAEEVFATLGFLRGSVAGSNND